MDEQNAGSSEWSFLGMLKFILIGLAALFIVGWIVIGVSSLLSKSPEEKFRDAFEQFVPSKQEQMCADFRASDDGTVDWFANRWWQEWDRLDATILAARPTLREVC